jgi:hypothetical protein
VTAGLMPKIERDGWNTTFFAPDSSRCMRWRKRYSRPKSRPRR